MNQFKLASVEHALGLYCIGFSLPDHDYVGLLLGHACQTLSKERTERQSWAPLHICMLLYIVYGYSKWMVRSEVIHDRLALGHT